MQLSGVFNYLGIETFTGRQDPTKSYASLAILQGTSVTKIFLTDEQLADINKLALKQMDPVTCHLEINIGQKTFVRLDSIKKIA
jgi:hypothetical protein